MRAKVRTVVLHASKSAKAEAEKTLEEFKEMKLLGDTGPAEESRGFAYTIGPVGSN